jgi:hypothetical protein
MRRRILSEDLASVRARGTSALGSKRADRRAQQKLPLRVDLTRSLSRRRMTGVCAQRATGIDGLCSLTRRPNLGSDSPRSLAGPSVFLRAMISERRACADSDSIWTGLKKPCMDAPARARWFRMVWSRDRVRSCIRPSGCGLSRPLAGMEMRGPGANQCGELLSSMASIAFPSPDLTDHLPLPFLDLLTRPTFPWPLGPIVDQKAAATGPR